MCVWLCLAHVVQGVCMLGKRCMDGFSQFVLPWSLSTDWLLIHQLLPQGFELLQSPGIGHLECSGAGVSPAVREFTDISIHSCPSCPALRAGPEVGASQVGGGGYRCFQHKSVNSPYVDVVGSAKTTLQERGEQAVERWERKRSRTICVLWREAGLELQRRGTVNYSVHQQSR